jgi:putative OPT family oligopeptide transporter
MEEDQASEHLAESRQASPPPQNPEREQTLSSDSAMELELERKLSYDEWIRLVYRGDHVPQLTVRAVLVGGVLGSLMSICNLYTSIKIGWSFGVAITACVLSFLLWNGLRVVFPKITPMSILENNCMQSTASAAGYSTGATVGTAFGALLLITGTHVDWRILLAWTFVSAALGVFLAVPMKRQMINEEQLPFPSGIAAAQTLVSLYGRSKHAVVQAKALLSALAVGLIVGFLGKGEFGWQRRLGLKIPDLLPFPIKIRGVDCSAMPAFGFEPSVLLIGAGMIVGLRVSASMFFGSLLLYLIVGPYMVHIGEIATPAKLIKGWSLWTGTALLVTSGLTAFALQWQQVVRAAGSVKMHKADAKQPSHSQIEVPATWLYSGVIPLVIAMVILQYVAFSITWQLGLLAVALSFFLALVACRSTGETDITPIGAMGKITQLTYALLAPSNITANLMAGSVTANIASSSADLLTDLKSGYLLGANPRRQFIAQFIGVFFGTLAIVPAWYLMVPNKSVMESFNAPSANMWRAVAEALAHGINYVPYLARWGLLVGGLLGILLSLLEAKAPKKLKQYLPSAMGLGLSWVVPFSSCLSFLLGALIAQVWSKFSSASASLFVIPVASGAVAGESLICAVIAMAQAACSLAK